MRSRGESGSAEALGLVLLTPMVVSVALLIVVVGLKVDQAAISRSAAAAAAQAAAAERDPTRARTAALTAVEVMGLESGTCPSPTVELEMGSYHPGGSVSVLVRCGSATGRSTAVVDRFRWNAP